MPSVDELAHRYSLISEQPLAHWDFYVSLAYFKIAIITAGIAFRSRMGGSEDGLHRAGAGVASLIAAGLNAFGSDV